MFLHAFLIILCAEQLMRSGSVFAQTTTVAVVNPLTANEEFKIFTNETAVGDTFIANITVTDVVDLYAWQIRLYFNPSIINITTSSDILLPADNVFAGKSPFNASDLRYDNEYLQLSQSLIGLEPPFSGSGVLCQIRFTINQYPPASGSVAANLTIANVDTFLLDVDLNDIPSTKSDGHYEYVWTTPTPSPWLEVSPSLVEYGPSPAIGEQFNISIWIKGLEVAWELVNITFSLAYDSTLIQAFDASEGNFLRDFGSTTFLRSMGANQVNVTNAFSSPATRPEGEGVAATVSFNVIYQADEPETRAAPIIFTSIELTDSIGKRIPLNSTNIVDGLYRIFSLTPSTLSLVVAPNSVTAGSNVTITGFITPARTDVDIVIQYKHGAEDWTTLRTIVTASDGSYTSYWQTADTGSYQFRATWSGDVNTLPAESDVKTVQVESPIEPPPASVDPLPYMLVAAILLAALIGVSLYAWKGRKLQR